jgi:hypothetical protein
MPITQERLKELLRYNRRTGIFHWKVHRYCVRAGAVAGHLQSDGYVRIKVDDKKYLAHTLAWLWVTGEWVYRGIDHKDLNPTNNKWRNLRRATHSQNMANRRIHKNNTVGFKGVRKRLDKFYNYPFRAIIGVNNKVILLGDFATAEEAYAAYLKGARKYFGKFAHA